MEGAIHPFSPRERETIERNIPDTIVAFDEGRTLPNLLGYM